MNLYNYIEFKHYKVVKIFLLVLLPFVIYFVPIDWLEEQRTICLYKNITGHDCYGCGITRAIVSAIQFKFKKAINYNYIVVVVFPILSFVWFKSIINLSLQILPTSKKTENY
jgi:hypothetical protein